MPKSSPALEITLQVAVPLHMAEMLTISDAHRVRIANRCADTLACHGDDLQYGGRRAAEAFNSLARGLAALALTAVGGVTFCGMHWCRVPRCPGPDADHPEPALEVPEQRRLVETLLPPLLTGEGGDDG